jgi:2'-5' RNA ligase
MIRLFAALAVPPEIGRALQGRQTGIDGARWRPLEAFHVTLRFFGEVRQDMARDLDEALLQVVARPFDIVLDGVGSFSDSDGPSAVWAGVQANPALSRLASACERAARDAGMEADARRYRPHVTLAYLRRQNPTQVALWLESHARLLSPPIPVTGFGLYSSQLSPEGSHYRLEAEYPFAQAGAA